MFSFPFTRFLLVAAAAPAFGAVTADLPKEHLDFFEKKIQPILKESCYKCHSLEQSKAKGGLTLDTKTGLLKGGENGAIVKPGEPEWDGLKVAQAAMQADDPLQGELLIERERWSFVESLAVGRFFDLEYLVSYALMLQALERRARFAAQRGQEGYETVYRSVLETADYRDESGESK